MTTERFPKPKEKAFNNKSQETQESQVPFKEGPLKAKTEAPLKTPATQGEFKISEKLPNGYKQVWCDNCFRHEYEYLNRPSDACGLTGLPVPTLDMVMAIPSGASERLQRDVVRGTWASVTRKNTDPKVRHVFLLGAVRDKHEQELIDAESEKHNDIVQQSFMDTYNNLTLKTMMMMEWAVSYCSNAKYIFKADSDLFINPTKIQAIISSHKNANTLIGRCNTAAHPIRSPKSKWVLTPEMYPQTAFPPFCLGPRYLIPVKVAQAVLEASRNTPPIRLEDVYLGMCLAKTPYKVENFLIDQYDAYINSPSCDKVRKVTSKHNVRGASIVSIWRRCFS